MSFKFPNSSAPSAKTYQAYTPSKLVNYICSSLFHPAHPDQLGFAFSNVQAANEFERQRNMFFSSSEQLDDFLEMREGMDLMSSSRFRDNILCVPTK